MASNDIEVLDPAATVEKHKETESGVALDRRHFLTALGVAGAAASVMAGADLLSSGPKAFAQFQPPIGGYKQVDVMNFLMNIKYLKATLYAFLTTGADIPNYPTNVTFGTGQIYDQPAKITNFPTQQITDLFNEMYYDELNQLVDLRNLIGNVTGDVQVIPRPTMDMLGSGNKSTTTTTMTFQQAIGYARMLEDLSVQAFAGAVAYLTGANLAYVSQIIATNGYHAGALRLISIQNNIPYISTDFLTTTAAGAQSLNTFSALVVPGLTQFYLSAVPTNAPVLGNAISGINIPQGALITAYAPAANSTFTAATNKNAILTSVSSVSGLAPYQPVSGTNIPAGAYIVPGGVGTNTVTISAATTATSTVAPTGYTILNSTTITGVSSITSIVAGQPITGTGIPPGATVVSASGTNIVISSAATATSQTTFFGLLTAGSSSITSVSSTSGITVGQPVLSAGGGIPAGTTISAIGNAITMSNKATTTTTQTAMTTTGTLTNGSTVITAVPTPGVFSGLVVGQPISGTGIGQGTVITALSSSAGTITMSNPANAGALQPTATLTAGSNVITGVSSLTGIAVGQPIAATGLTISQVTIPAGSLVGSISASTSAITLSPPSSIPFPFPTGIVASGSISVTSVSPTTGLVVGQSIAGNFIPAGATIAGISGSTVTMSAAATGSSVTAETLVIVNAVTATVTSGSASLTVSSAASLAVGQTLSGPNIVPGTTIASISGTTVTMEAPATFTFTGTVLSGTNTASSLVNTPAPGIGQTITGTNIPSATTITAINLTTGTLTMSKAATGTSGALVELLNATGAGIGSPSNFIGTVTGGSASVTGLSFTAGLAVGQLIVGNNLPVGTVITGVSATTNSITLSNLVSGTSTSPTPEPLTIYSGTITAPTTAGFIGALTGASNTVTSLMTTTGVTAFEVAAAGLAVGQGITGTNIPPGTIITSINASAGTLTMSNASTGTNTSPVLESLGITAVSITVPLTPLGFSQAAYYSSFAGAEGVVSIAYLPAFVNIGNPVVTGVPALSGLAIGQPIYGNYIPAGTTVAAVGAGAASATNPGVGTVTMSNAAVYSSSTYQPIVIGVPTSAIVTVGLIAPLTALTITTTQTFTTPNTVTLSVSPAANITVTVGRGLLTIALPPGLAVTGTAGPQTLTMLTGDIMDVQPYDPGTAALAAAGPAAITIPSSVYSTTGPTNPTVYQGFFNTASASISSASPGTATGTSTPAGLMFARSFGQTLSALYGTTQTDTYTGGFFPASPGVGGTINVNTDQ